MEINSTLINWYLQHKRDLPWRNTKNPYKIWLSEVILQQTRVQQGLPYFEKFIKNYPTVTDLATAEEQEILNDWQGLGYYSRARNMHTTAKLVVEHFNGKFPSSFTELLKLKGIGEYTAAAIASFAFNEQVAVVDGNVYRVLSRLFDIELPIDSGQGKVEFKNLAKECLGKEPAAIFNQAIMEFGALFCVPKNPDCSSCIFQNSCLALANKTVDQRPVKAKKTKVSDRYLLYTIALDKGKIQIEKRNSGEIWEGLFQFPLNELKTEDDWQKAIRTDAIFVSERYKHILSHQRLHVYFQVTIEKHHEDNKFIVISPNDFHHYPIPRLIEKFWEKHQQVLNQ